MINSPGFAERRMLDGDPVLSSSQSPTSSLMNDGSFIGSLGTVRYLQQQMEDDAVALSFHDTQRSPQRFQLRVNTGDGCVTWHHQPQHWRITHELRWLRCKPCVVVRQTTCARIEDTDFGETLRLFVFVEGEWRDSRSAAGLAAISNLSHESRPAFLSAYKHFLAFPIYPMALP